MKNVVIQGLGFVGSAMAVAVAQVKGKNGDPLFNVIGVDQNNQLGRSRIKSINCGVFPFQTNDNTLDSAIKDCVKNGNLTVTHDQQYFTDADIVLVSINCDLEIDSNENCSIDLDSFSLGVHQIANLISENTLIIVESTVPPGTCEKILKPLIDRTATERSLNTELIYLAHSYERVMPGENYLGSISNYWRVFAGINDDAACKCEEFLSHIINTDVYPLTRLDSTTASETAKLLENSFRAVNIAFIEEWGRFAEEVGIDIYEVIEAIRMRPTHSNMRQPGFGVGGYCLTKDPLFAKIAARDLFGLSGHEFPFSTNAIEVNKLMPLVTLNKLKHYFNGTLSNRKLLLMGVSYRQDVDDTRHSPSELFVREAEKLGVQITAYDPLVEYWYEMDLKLPTVIPDFLQYDAVVFAVPHKEFQKLRFTEQLNDQRLLIFDANKVLSNKQIEAVKNGQMDFQSIGRG
jgi:UDP-N-acetyl-D-glucosamine dehydrogenase